MAKYGFLNDPIFVNTSGTYYTTSTSTSGDWVIKAISNEPVHSSTPPPRGDLFAEQNIALFVQELRSADGHTVEWDEMCGEPCDDFYPITVVIDGVSHDVEIPGFVSATDRDKYLSEVEVFVDGECVDWDSAVLSLTS